MKHKILFFQNCSHIFFPKELILSNQLKKNNWQKFSPYSNNLLKKKLKKHRRML